MPRKDGSPTAAERRDAERQAANRAYVAGADDAELDRIESDPVLCYDSVLMADVAAERARRSATVCNEPVES